VGTGNSCFIKSVTRQQGGRSPDKTLADNNLLQQFCLFSRTSSSATAGNWMRQTAIVRTMSRV